MSTDFWSAELSGWFETQDGCYALHLIGSILPRAVVCPVFSSEPDEKWQVNFYGPTPNPRQFFETKEEAQAIAVALLRME